MKSLIVYFSQCGSVTRVAQSIKTGLQDAGYEVTLWNIQDGQPPDVFNYDLLGIGSPTYYFRPPFNLIDLGVTH
jgi:flavodoxin